MDSLLTFRTVTGEVEWGRVLLYLTMAFPMGAFAKVMLGGGDYAQQLKYSEERLYNYTLSDVRGEDAGPGP